MINLDELLKGPDSRLHMLEHRGYLYKVRVFVLLAHVWGIRQDDDL